MSWDIHLDDFGPVLTTMCNKRTVIALWPCSGKKSSHILRTPCLMNQGVSPGPSRRGYQAFIKDNPYSIASVSYLYIWTKVKEESVNITGQMQYNEDMRFKYHDALSPFCIRPIVLTPQTDHKQETCLIFLVLFLLLGTENPDTHQSSLKPLHKSSDD